jgi:hypothetical protein
MQRRSAHRDIMGHAHKTWSLRSPALSKSVDYLLVVFTDGTPEMKVTKVGYASKFNHAHKSHELTGKPVLRFQAIGCNGCLTLLLTGFDREASQVPGFEGNPFPGSLTGDARKFAGEAHTHRDRGGGGWVGWGGFGQLFVWTAICGVEFRFLFVGPCRRPEEFG